MVDRLEEMERKLDYLIRVHEEPALMMTNLYTNDKGDRCIKELLVKIDSQNLEHIFIIRPHLDTWKASIHDSLESALECYERIGE